MSSKPNPQSLPQNADYNLVVDFIHNHQRCDSQDVKRLLEAAQRLLEQYPENELIYACIFDATPLCKPHLFLDNTILLDTLQQQIFKALLTCTDPSMCQRALVHAASLWRDHTWPIPMDCQVVASLIKTVLDFEKHGNVALTTSSCSTFLKSIVSYSDTQQRTQLQAAGIESYLHLLLEKKHLQMGTVELEDLLACLLAFAEVDTATFIKWSSQSVTSLVALISAQSTTLTLKVSTWKLLSIHVRHIGPSEPVPIHVLELAVCALNPGDPSLSGAVLHFLHIACETSKHTALNYLKCEGLLKALMSLAVPGSGIAVDNICHVISAMLQVATPGDAVQSTLFAAVEDCARLSLQTCLPLACSAMQKVLSVLDQKDTQGKIFQQDHSAFFKDMLTNEAVYTSEQLLKLVYGTLTSMLRKTPSSLTTLSSLQSSNFVSLLVTTFERDTVSLALAPVVVDMWLAFVPQNGGTSALADVLHEARFLATLIKILNNKMLIPQAAKVLSHVTCTEDESMLRNATCLLSRAVALYKTTKMLQVVSCGVQDFISDYLKVASTVHSKQLITNLCQTLFDIILSKEACVELHRVGYTEKLLQVQRPDCPLIHKFVMTALSNIAIYEHKALMYMIEKKHYLAFLDQLKGNVETQDQYLLGAWCKFMRTLSEDDTAKKSLIEKGCIPALKKILALNTTNTYMIARALGLLASLISSSATSCDDILTEDVILTVGRILHTIQDEDVLAHAALLLFESIQVDRFIVPICRAAPLHLLTQIKRTYATSKFLNDAVTMLIKRIGLNCVVGRGDLIPHSAALDTGRYDWPPFCTSLTQSSLKPCCPSLPELDAATKEILISLGLNMEKPVFRIGQMDGVHSILSSCYVNSSTCNELIVRPGRLSLEQYQILIDHGWFRRGGVKLHRTAKSPDVNCTVWETRVLVNSFNYHSSKSYAKVMRRIPADRLTIETHPAHYLQEAHQLYNQYMVHRHDKCQASEYHYREHVIDSPIMNQTIDGIEYGTFHQLYRLDGKLVAVGLIDIVPKGIVSLYMWYSMDKEVSKYSLGVYSALKEIEMVQELSKKNPEMKYYYLQGWDENSKKVAYKARYSPGEFYCACITPEWLPSLEAVKEARQKYLQEHTPNQSSTPCSNGTLLVTVDTTNKDKKSSNDVACSAFEKDRAKYEQLTGHKPDVSKIVVCLNYATYLHLGEMFSKFNVDQSQKELMERRFEELLVAIGPELGSQLVVDIRICPFSGEFL